MVGWAYQLWKDLTVMGLTLEARLSTRATMEFLKSVPAVNGRLVTSVMSCCPSGHMARRVGSLLWTQALNPASLA